MHVKINRGLSVNATCVLCVSVQSGGCAPTLHAGHVTPSTTPAAATAVWSKRSGQVNNAICT